MRFFYISSFIIFSLQMASGQCYPDRHSTNWFDGWVSCEEFPNPNPKHGMSHWIMYDLGQEYALKNAHVWNSNDPANLNRGLKEVAIEYSKNGSDWSEAGTFTFPQADGTSIYQGFDGPVFDGINARYVLLTALENWGGPCFGLSEILFEAEDAAITDVSELENPADRCFSIQAYPNPFTAKSRLIIQSQCEKAINYRISDVLGRVVSTGIVGETSGYHTLEIDGKTLPSGNYIVAVNQGTQFVQQHLLKID